MTIEEPTNSTLIARAQAGDAAAFQDLCAPHRQELVLHCYRFTGSLAEAEDLVQETLLRAWRGLPAFEGRSSLRTWLYKVSTNLCLGHVEGRRSRRVLFGEAPSDPQIPALQALDDSHWLEPLPTPFDEGEPSPEARYSRQQSVALAFVAALQVLPPRQRAALILRDVVGLKADEVAELLDVGPAAVNSLLQRARESLQDVDPERPLKRPSESEAKKLLHRYLEAWKRGDVAEIIDLLKLDAVVSMPPLPGYFVGPAAGEFLRRFVMPPGAAHRFWLEPTEANGQPACVVWESDGDGRWRSSGLHVLTLVPGGIAAIAAFMDPRLPGRFGFPEAPRLQGR